MSERALVVGGGPAGAIAALHLARAGLAPLLLERDAAPAHRICGEFLSGEMLAVLAEAGVDPLALGAAPIDRIRLVRGAKVAEAPLPFAAMGLSRRRMDVALLEAAAAAGARVSRGVTVRRLTDAGVETSSGEVRAERIVLASGKHDLRGAARDTAGTMADLVGFKMHYRLPATEATAGARAIELILFDGGYAGLQPIDDGRFNLCLLLSRTRLAALGGDWGAVIGAIGAETPHLARRLGQAEPLFERPLAIAGVPYGYRHTAAPGDRGGLYRAGDQLAVVPSFAGDGMAIAVASGRAAALALAAGEDAQSFHARWRRGLAPQFAAASIVHRLIRSSLAARIGIGVAAGWPGAMTGLARATRLPPGLR